jgi:serine/threonine-protein kinase RsbW
MAVRDRVVQAMNLRGYADAEIFGVRLALEEALVNAVKHGNRNDSTKCVWASWHVGAQRVFVEIEDEGEGFDPRAVPDPCAPENLERSCGRGLLLMRTYMSRVRYNRRGNRVTMIKRRAST